MLLSKTFGYALRGILYIAEKNGSGTKTNLDEIARNLKIPRHFLAKVMKRLVKEGILTSTKGPYGGFSINKRTLTTSLLQLAEFTGENASPDTCVLNLGNCSAQKPCVLHERAEKNKNSWHGVLKTTTVADLLSYPKK